MYSLKTHLEDAKLIINTNTRSVPRIDPENGAGTNFMFSSCSTGKRNWRGHHVFWKLRENELFDAVLVD